jgi:hypothetical protein
MVTGVAMPAPAPLRQRRTEIHHFAGIEGHHVAALQSYYFNRRFAGLFEPANGASRQPSYNVSVKAI